MLNNGALNIFDGDRRLNEAKHTGAFAGSGANPSRKLREVVGFCQPVVGFVPESVVDIVIPLGHKIVDGAATRHTAQHESGVAVGCAAIHAAGTLLLQLRGIHLLMKLLPVFYPLQRRPVGGQCSLVLHETFNFTHINDLIFFQPGYATLFRY